jgi:MFS family permease
MATQAPEGSEPPGPESPARPEPLARPEPPARSGIWAPERRALSIGLVLTITLVASEALAVVTILPLIRQDLGGLRLYGWVTSAFFLGSLFGIVLAGQEADRRGPAPPFVAGLVLFAAGLAVGGAAPSMGVLVLGRAIQGVGAGAIPAVAYVSIGRSYPEALQPRIFAVLSTAWVIPGLIGPGVSALVAERAGWRWVFFGLIPLVAGSGCLTVRSLRGLAPVAREPTPGRTVDALRVAAGTGLVLAGLTATSPIAAPPLVAAGVVVGFAPLRRLLPPGTLSARPGLPVAVLSRGLLTFAFFGTDAFVPLTITSVRGRSTAVASVVVTLATLTWTAGAWVQERRSRSWSGRRLVTMGLVIVVAGIGCFSLVLFARVPLFVAGIGWGIGGFGIGLAYAPISVIVLGQARAGQEGAASASMQLADNLGVALGAGLGGAALAVGEALGWQLRAGLAVAFAAAAAVGLIGVATAQRLPQSVLAARDVPR